ncbi:hypothetical protein LFM09_36525 [Lentzea alba]|uniref:hypothetical protein n=1 Tax=Lentzea alba TaxID=2714351 RepID=UPI0039BF19D2
MKRLLGITEMILYIAIGVVLTAFSMPWWARILVIVMVLGVEVAATRRTRLALQETART